MRIRSGAVVQGRSIEVELEESDLELLDVANLHPHQRFMKASAHADRMVVMYLHQNHLITTEQAKTRMIDINKALNGG